MRDPKRIREILNQLAIYWEKRPDLRFFQVLIGLRLDDAPSDLFFYEDDDFLKQLERLNNSQ